MHSETNPRLRRRIVLTALLASLALGPAGAWADKPGAPGAPETETETESEALHISLGDYFEAFIHGSVDNSESRPVGTSQFKFGFQLAGPTGSGDVVQVRITQGSREIGAADCRPARGGHVTRCEAEAVPATRIDPRRRVDIRYVHVNGTTDAETELLRASYPVFRTFEWVGNRNGRPAHIERRQLRLDSALGLFVLEDRSDGQVYTREDVAYLRLFYWDATAENYPSEPWSLRCRLTPEGADAPGEWAGYDIGRPSPSIGPGVTVENRYYDTAARDANTETVRFQRYAFNVSMPFSVSGSRPLDAPRDVDGAWQCQLRAGTGRGRRVVREFAFRVSGNAAQPHALQSSLSLGEKQVAATVTFDPAHLPASFDPALVRGELYGVEVPDEAQLVTATRGRPVNPRFRVPSGMPRTARVR